MVTSVDEKGVTWMTASDATKMSPAEWELMRIIWTKGGASSSEVIELIQKKTFLDRIDSQDFVKKTCE